MISDNMMKLIEAQARLVGVLGSQVAQMLAAVWRPYRHWTDYDLGISQAARSATIVESAARNTRMRQRAYLKQVYKQMDLPMPTDSIIDLGSLGDSIPGGVDVYLRRGVTPLDVYQRPAEEFRYFKSTGLSDAEALQKAVDRATTMANTDLMLNKRDESRRVFQNTHEVMGYRRIIHPERSQSGMSCGLCVVASQRIYHTNQLMPIHDECNCDVLPITTDNDPGHQLNQDDLQALYNAAGGNTASDLLNTKVSFLEHGELGPIIAGGNRKGSKQRKAAKDVVDLTPEEAVNKQLHTLTKSSAKLESRLKAGEDVSQSLEWQRDRIFLLQRRLSSIRRQK